MGHAVLPLSHDVLQPGRISRRRVKIVEEFRRVDAFYRTNDIRIAEKALLEHRQDLIKKRDTELKGIDYDTALAIANGRLFLIYKSLGESNKAQQFFRQSADSFNNRRKKHGVELEKFSEELLTEKIEKWDSTSSVGWRTNTIK